MVLAGAHHGFAQTPSPSPAPPVHPLQPEADRGSPALETGGALSAAPAPSADAAIVTPGAAAVPPAPAPHFYERWWFWTAIGAAAITTVVILAVASSPGAPRTDLGNMPAF